MQLIRFRLSSTASILFLFQVLQFSLFTILDAQEIKNPMVVLSDSSRTILQQKIDLYRSERNLPMGALITQVGLGFLNTPYVGKTLDISNDQERLIINLQGLDCTTFVETCLALARTVKSNMPGIQTYETELQKIRYRSGELKGYASRLHYFTEWIRDNEKKQIVQDITPALGGEIYPVMLSFMSMHPQFYPQLVADSTLVPVIAGIEKKISGGSFYYIPEEKLEACEGNIRDGDIAAITTATEGIDIAHTGLLLHRDNRIYMLHASSIHKQVEVTEIPLADYLAGIKNMTGIMVIRPSE
jgi:hypothetical protein